jgi:hypothetical protein
MKACVGETARAVEGSKTSADEGVNPSQIIAIAELRNG